MSVIKIIKQPDNNVVTIKTGQPGPTGATGAGVPVGGTADQVLAKVDGVDYNTFWTDFSAVVASLNNIGDVTIAGPTANDIVQWNGFVWVDRSLAEAGIAHPDIGATFDGGIVGVLQSGMVVRRVVEQSCTLVSASIVADVSGSITITIRRYTPVGGSLGSATLLKAFALSGAESIRDVDLSDWASQTCAAGDVLEFEITGTPLFVRRVTITIGRVAP